MSGASQAAEMNRFLAEVETSAFQLARYAVRDTDEALDLVQDAQEAEHRLRLGDDEERGTRRVDLHVDA